MDPIDSWRRQRPRREYPVHQFFSDGSASLPPGSDLQRMFSQAEHYSGLFPEHAILARLVGLWKVRIDFDMYDLGPSFVSEGQFLVASADGGRMIVGTQRSVFADTPYTNVVCFYWDPVVEKFFLTIQDSQLNGISVFEGDYDAERDALTFWGEFTNGMFRQRVEVHVAFTFKGDKGLVMTWHHPNYSGEYIETMHGEMKLVRRRIPPLNLSDAIWRELMGGFPEWKDVKKPYRPRRKGATD